MSSHSRSSPHSTVARFRLVSVFLSTAILAVIARLFYWQIIKAPVLQAEAQEQYERRISIQGKRGNIYTSDGFLLVGNTQVYRVFAEPPKITDDVESLAKSLATELLSYYPAAQIAQTPEELQTATQTFTQELHQKLSKSGSKWVALVNGISTEDRDKLKATNYKGIGFEPMEQRLYPEASMAAHITGFVGKNDQSEETGYFGIEGALDKELKGRLANTVVQKDALGLILSGQQSTDISTQGRDVVLTIRRDVQYLLEKSLEEGVKKYGAQAGEAIVMEPSTGKIIGMATYPHYDPRQFSQFEGSLYKNPIVADVFEPGSIFKPLTIAAGIDAGLINPSTQCPRCAEPRVIDEYTIKTWNNVYTADISMSDALAKSDNTAMIYVAELLGTERFKEYTQKFGIGQRLNIALQEETDPPFPTKWGPVELATRSFGQGIGTTSLHMVRAIGAIANKGTVVRPTLVEKVIDTNQQKEIAVEPILEGQAITPETARTVTEMMVYASNKGEAQWTTSKDHFVAGKTGTSQVAVDGKYDEKKTIATYVGFAPPHEPKFVMLIKLKEPGTSPWAAETAAPLWYKIADKLYLLLNIPPDR